MYAKLFNTVTPKQTIALEPYSSIAHEARSAYPDLTVIDYKSSTGLAMVRKALIDYGVLS